MGPIVKVNVNIPHMEVLNENIDLEKEEYNKGNIDINELENRIRKMTADFVQIEVIIKDEEEEKKEREKRFMESLSEWKERLKTGFHEFGYETLSRWHKSMDNKEKI